MNCPRCKTEIGEKDLVCQNCKKVLRLQCPSCGSISKNTVCEKCGSMILNKCYKCGRLNSTGLETCPKCGLNVNASIGLRESVIEEFAVLTIEITNFEDIKAAFKSAKITDQFKKNLYTMIKKTAAQKKLRVQFLNDTFIIRFCKDYSFIESCNSALDFSIYVAQSVTEINQKLFEAKGIALKTQMAVQKRDVYSKPSEYKSGININVVYSSSGKSHLFNNIEVIVDSYVYQVTKVKYPYQSLSAVYIKNQMVMFFELILHKLIKLEKEKEEDKNLIKLPQNVDFVPEEETDESALINFSGLNCTFLRAKGETILNEIEKIKNKNVENPVISIKGDARSGKLALLSDNDLQKVYSGHNIVRFSCPDKNKYCAYGLLKQMLLAYKNTSELSVLLNPSAIEGITQDSNLQHLLKMQVETHAHPEDLRYGYFDSFMAFIASIPYKTLFVIEDFENADDSSVEIIKYLIENKSMGNIGFIVSCEKDYSLHRKIYKLMTSNNYFEIEMKPSANKTIVAGGLAKIKEIKDSFFFEKVLENTKGSHFYFDQALKYLADDNILELKDGKYYVKKEKMLVIPKDFDELIQKRILHLQTIENAFELFGSILLASERMPVTAVHSLGIKDDIKIIKYLQSNDFVEILDDKEILVKHYNLYRTNFIIVCPPEKIKDLSINLLEKIYININSPNFIKAQLLEFAKIKKEAFAQWHSLAMISSQIGDFCAYLNCTNKFLSLVDNVIDADTDRTVEQVKMDVYGELASMLYKYYPDKIINFLEMLLENLEEKKDDQKIKEVANKLVQSCLISGNYNNALEYIGKIIARTQRSSFNPYDKNFNLNYFLVHLVTLEIYFNLGRLNECIELGEELFKHIDLKTITESVLPEGFSKKQFDDAILDALFFINAARVIQLKPDKREKIERVINEHPQNYACFRLLYLFVDFFEGKDIMHSMNQIAQSGLNDKYSQILFPILQGLITLKLKDYNGLGNYVYNAKIKAADIHLHQLEYFCDLMIGYAYLNIGNLKKAKQIFYNILDVSSDKGLKNIGYMSWFLISKAEYLENNFNMAIEILNNSLLKMEKDSNISEFFMLIFKTFFSEIMLTSGPKHNFEQALYSCEQAFESSVKRQLYVYLPQIADMLIFIYNQILNSQQTQEIIDTYQKKIQYVQQTMTGIFNTSSAR